MAVARVRLSHLNRNSKVAHTAEGGCECEEWRRLVGSLVQRRTS